MLTHPHSTLPTRRRVRQVLEPFVAEAAQLPGVDRYRKRFTTEAHLWTLVLHGLSGMPSLRQTHAQLAAQPELWHQWGLHAWVSLSQLARSSTSRPAAPFELLAHRLLAAAGAAGRHAADARSLQALDSTFLPLSGARSPWARHGQIAAGLRLHVLLDLSETDPDDERILDLRLTGTEINDHDALVAWDLRALSGRTLLIDLGYYGHRQLARLRQAGIDVIMPAHPQAHTTVLTEFPVPAERAVSSQLHLLADQHVQVGSPNNRRGTVLLHLRQVTVQTADGIHSLLTTRFDLPADQVVQAYRRRWRIELLFRWIKHQLGTLPPIGTSPQAVWITALLAVIVQALFALLHHHKPATISRIAWMRQLAIQLQRDLPVPAG